jgi:hypothetical protein
LAAHPKVAPIAHPAPDAPAPIADASPARALEAAPTPLLTRAGTYRAPTGDGPARTGPGLVPNPLARWSAPAIDGRPLLPYTDSALSFSPSDTASRKIDDHRSTPAPPKHAGGRPSPAPPAGPPGGTGAAGSAGGSGGGASSGLFCAILVALLAYPIYELRRHRFRLVLAAPAGVVFPQQRPG